MLASNAANGAQVGEFQNPRKLHDSSLLVMAHFCCLHLCELAVYFVRHFSFVINSHIALQKPYKASARPVSKSESRLELTLA